MRNKQLWLTFLAITIPLCGVVALLWQQARSKQAAHSQLLAQLQEAKELYNQHQYDASLELISGREESFIPEEDGCELLISLYAEREGQASKLEQLSRLCLQQGKGIGIAHEGLAKALYEQGQGASGIAFLQQQTQQYPQARVFAALAHLHLLQEQYHEAGLAFVQAIAAAGEEWSIWLQRSLRFAPIATDREFLQAVTPIVVKKSNRNTNIEARLIEALQVQELSAEVQRLQAEQLQAH
jgi:hypothetical protein